jgi:hypothetical protein
MAWGFLRRALHPPARALKFRQAAIVYLHYAVLYELGAWALYQRELFPETRGPAAMWFAMGATIAALVVWGLWSWQNPWFTRAIWVLLALRLPTLIEGAFLGSDLRIQSGLYIMAGLVVLATMAMLARAGWDV